MKKIFHLLLVITTIISVTACKNDDTLWDLVNNKTTKEEEPKEDQEEPATTEITVEKDENSSKIIGITYNDKNAIVKISSDIFSSISVKGEGAHVCVLQSSSITDEITYSLSGTSTNGSFYMDGSTAINLEFNNLSLTTAADSAVVNIQDGKQININLIGTTTLADVAANKQKGAVVINGHSEFDGSGILNIAGNAANAIWADEYIQLEKSMTGTINITKAVTDGINVNQHLEQNGGILNISGIGDEGLQVGAQTGNSKENGFLNIAGGKLTINSTSKGIKTDGAITISGGNISVSSSASEGIEGGSTINVNDGTIIVKAYQDAVNSKKNMTINGGTITAISQTNDGLDSNANMYIKGGTIMAFGGSAPECAIDAAEGYGVYITGGNVLGVGGSTFKMEKNGQAYINTTGKVYANTSVSLSKDGTVLASFTIPAEYTGNSNNITLSCPNLTTGESYTLTNGSATTNVVAKAQ